MRRRRGRPSRAARLGFHDQSERCGDVGSVSPIASNSPPDGSFATGSQLAAPVGISEKAAEPLASLGRVPPYSLRLMAAGIASSSWRPLPFGLGSALNGWRCNLDLDQISDFRGAQLGWDAPSLPHYQGASRNW
jgi:hypothetical protein